MFRYKFWADSSFWLPLATKAPQILGNAYPAIDSEHSIPRKIERGQVTRGQMAAKIRNADVKCVRALDTDANATQEENWSPFENCTADDSFSSSLPGIQWIYNSPFLDDVPYVCFSAEDHQRLLKNSLKIKFMRTLEQSLLQSINFCLMTQ